jgi:hypothetical protein
MVAWTDGEESERDERSCTHFSDVDETSHKLLVGERVDGVLSLLTSCIFHNSVAMSQLPCAANLAWPRAVAVLGREGTRGWVQRRIAPAKTTYPHPYNNRGQPVQSVNPTFHNFQEKKKPEHQPTIQPTFDIPFGSNSTSAKSTSPATRGDTHTS